MVTGHCPLLPPEADIRQRIEHVCFVPKAEVKRRANHQPRQFFWALGLLG
jgi:hypothetical protein